MSIKYYILYINYYIILNIYSYDDFRTQTVTVSTVPAMRRIITCKIRSLLF